MVTALRTGVFLDGREPPGTVAAMARIAEERGCQRLWFASHLFHRDAAVQAMAALSATRRIGVALTAVSPFVVHPVQIAMTAASLAEHFPGRVTLSLGAGAPGDMDAAGIDRDRPLGLLEETILVCRALFAGDTIVHEGERLRVKGRKLENAPCQVPIMLAATGPRMLAMSGRRADGVLLSAATSVEFVKACLAEVDAEVPIPEFCRSGLVFVSVDDDPRRAHDRLRPVLAYILRGAHHAPNLAMAGVQLDQDALYAAVKAGDWERAIQLISDHVVEQQTASGNPETVRARIAAYRSSGLDEIVVAGIGNPEDLGRALDAMIPPT